MRKSSKAAVASIGVAIALAGCGSATKTGTAPPTTVAPAVTTPTPSTTVPAAPVLSSVEKTDLGGIHEQERAGLDAYSVFAARYTVQPVFANLARSQRTQLATVTAMMARYRLGDPSAGLAAGRYSDPSVQQLYDSTVAAGTSADHALDAVEHFEQHNLVSLRTVRAHTARTDLIAMYSNLEQASNAHITACDDAQQHAGGHD